MFDEKKVWLGAKSYVYNLFLFIYYQTQYDRIARQTELWRSLEAVPCSPALSLLCVLDNASLYNMTGVHSSKADSLPSEKKVTFFQSECAVGTHFAKQPLLIMYVWPRLPEI